MYFIDYYGFFLWNCIEEEFLSNRSLVLREEFLLREQIFPVRVDLNELGGKRKKDTLFSLNLYQFNIIAAV